MVTLDADGQHKPEDLPRLVAALEGADLVVGARVRTGAMPPHRRLGNALSAGFLTWLAGTPLPDVQSGYRVHRRAVLEALGLARPAPRPRGGAAPAAPPTFRSTGYGFESEILVAAARLGFTIANVPIEAVYEGAPSHLHPLRELPTLRARSTRGSSPTPAAGRRARRRRGRGRDGVNILVTNDDGITSPALYLLRQELSDLGTRLHRRARSRPERDQPLAHALPARCASSAPSPTCSPSTARRPTACDRGRTGSSEPRSTSWCRGVNRGPNMGDDVFYSGTVAAAIEGAMQGVPALAVSLATSGRADFAYACAVRAPARRARCSSAGCRPSACSTSTCRSWRDDEIQGVRVTRLGKRKYEDTLIERNDPRGRAYYWIGGRRADVGARRRGPTSSRSTRAT